MDASSQPAARKPRAVQMVVANRRDLGSVVSDDDARLMVAAANLLLPELAAAWDYRAPAAVFAGDAAPAPGAWRFELVGEDPGAPGALAYHVDTDAPVDGVVLTKTILTNGGVPLHGADPAAPTVAGALFHELAEAFIDPMVNTWWQDANGVFYCGEVCDPVQGNNVVVEAALPGKPPQRVALSDFVFPAWRDADVPAGAPARQLNYLNTLRHPFEIAPGGYVVRFDPATDSAPQPVFGRRAPAWLRAMKAQSRRLGRRARGL